MFDLPVVEKKERYAATKFRNFLLDEGFHMAQYSVYYRLLSGRDAAQTLERKIERNLPGYGSIQVLLITDKQYEGIRIFRGKDREFQENPPQLALF